MDERYNYFYEQKRRDGMDWDAVYREYYPKFEALKTYDGSGTVTEKKSRYGESKTVFYRYYRPNYRPTFFCKFYNVWFEYQILWRDEK